MLMLLSMILILDITHNSCVHISFKLCLKCENGMKKYLLNGVTY